MIFKLPEFKAGKPNTLLEAKNAEIIRKFVEAFQQIEIVEGENNRVLISDTNVKFIIKPSSSNNVERIFRMTLVPAGILPTLEETRDAIIDAFDGKSPQVGDLVVGDLFNYKIFSRSDANGESITNLSLQRIHLEIDGKLVMAVQVGPSRLI